MSQQTRTAAANVIHLPENQVKLEAIDIKALSDKHHLEITLNILQSLYHSLDIEYVVDKFINEFIIGIHYSGVRYQNTELGIDFKQGEKAEHQCQYALTIEKDDLGKLTFSHVQQFPPKELERIEELLCILVYPLRNAIHYQRAQRAAHLDPLTGLNNRTLMEQQINREIAIAKRHRTPLSLMIIDIDNFKIINDQYGHLAGDRVINDIAHILKNKVRCTELLFRYAGDEFVIIFSNTDLQGATTVAKRIHKVIEDFDFFTPQGKASVTLSIGLTQFQPEDNTHSLFSRTDKAMYDAKNKGRNRIFAG